MAKDYLHRSRHGGIRFHALAPLLVQLMLDAIILKRDTVTTISLFTNSWIKKYPYPSYHFDHPRFDMQNFEFVARHGKRLLPWWQICLGTDLMQNKIGRQTEL